MDSFWENRKKSKNGCFLAIFGLIWATFLTSQPYDFDAFAHAGAPLGVEWLCKISWKSYGQFLRNLKFSWKGREKKNSTIALVEIFFRLLKTKKNSTIAKVVENFFPTPKNGWKCAKYLKWVQGLFNIFYGLVKIRKYPSKKWDSLHVILITRRYVAY